MAMEGNDLDVFTEKEEIYPQIAENVVKDLRQFLRQFQDRGKEVVVIRPNFQQRRGYKNFKRHVKG